MNKLIWVLGFLLCVPNAFSEDSKSAAAESVERRQKVEILQYFLKDPKDAQVPTSTLAVGLYNQAVQHFQNHDYDLARKALKDSLAYDQKNPLAYELLGDIDYYQQNLSEAKANYEIAYALQPTESLKKSIEKIRNESKVEKKLSTYREQHFIIKYHNEDRSMDGFELRELLRKTYLDISKDFAFYFKNQVVVLLYDPEEFRKLNNVPHWAGGLYDGKVRMPLNRQGFSEQALKALTAHEVTHAFVAQMGGTQVPAWLNEGLAEYEESRIEKPDQSLFQAALKNGSLFPIDQMMGQASTSTLQDTSKAGLFYQQAYQMVSYMVSRYRMYRMKELMAQFAQGKNSDEALRAVLHISPTRLEKEWKESLSN